MKRIFLVIGLSIAIGALAFGGGYAIHATLAPQVYAPSEVQLLRLQVKQRDAQIAQIAMQDSTTKFSKALDDLKAESEKIKTENKWDSTILFDPNTLKFSKAVLTPQTPAPVPAKK